MPWPTVPVNLADHECKAFGYMFAMDGRHEVLQEPPQLLNRIIDF